MVDGDPVALINLESERVRLFNESDADLVGVMAEHVSSALRNILIKEKMPLSREMFYLLEET